MTRDEFVKLWGDKYLGIVARAAAQDKGTALYGRWLALQVGEVDAWLATLYDALPGGANDTALSLAPPPEVQERWVVRALVAMWGKVFEPTVVGAWPAAPMNRLPEQLTQWLAVEENRNAVTAWLNERVRERQAA